MITAVLLALLGTPTSVSVSERDGAWRVEGSFVVDAPREIAWQVLTDYDHLPAFISSMQESRVTARHESEVIVEQIATGKVFFFSQNLRVTLRIHEHGKIALSFEDFLHGDFDRYEGTWTIQPDAAGCRIDYRLSATPHFSLPKFMLAPALQADAQSLLGEVRSEIQRRTNPSRMP